MQDLLQTAHQQRYAACMNELNLYFHRKRCKIENIPNEIQENIVLILSFDHKKNICKICNLEPLQIALKRQKPDYFLDDEGITTIHRLSVANKYWNNKIQNQSFMEKLMVFLSRHQGISNIRIAFKLRTPHLQNFKQEQIDIYRMAIETGDVDVVEKLFDDGLYCFYFLGKGFTNRNASTYLGFFDNQIVNDKNTDLSLAASYGHTNIIKKLIQKKGTTNYNKKIFYHAYIAAKKYLEILKEGLTNEGYQYMANQEYIDFFSTYSLLKVLSE